MAEHDADLDVFLSSLWERFRSELVERPYYHRIAPHEKCHRKRQRLRGMCRALRILRAVRDGAVLADRDECGGCGGTGRNCVDDSQLCPGCDGYGYELEVWDG